MRFVVVFSQRNGRVAGVYKIVQEKIRKKFCLPNKTKDYFLILIKRIPKYLATLPLNM
jgi:hypothetical protein